MILCHGTNIDFDTINLTKSHKYKDFGQGFYLTDYIYDYDIVIGPIADDGVAYLLGLYDEGVITIGDLSKRLEYKNLNRQYFFGTEKSLKHLKRL